MTALGHPLRSRRREAVLAGFVGLVIVAWPAMSLGHPVVALVAAAPLAGLYAVLVAPGWQRAETSTIAAFGFLAAMELWRQADHTAAAAFAVLAALPVIWTALYLPRRRMWLMIAAVAALLWAPVFVANRRYPMSNARAATLCMVVIAVIGWLIASAFDRSRLLETADTGPAAARSAATEPAGTATDITSSGTRALVRAT